MNQRIYNDGWRDVLKWVYDAVIKALTPNLKDDIKVLSSILSWFILAIPHVH